MSIQLALKHKHSLHLSQKMEKICSALVFLSALQVVSVKGSCCNNNYWCDGDPRYSRNQMVDQTLVKLHLHILQFYRDA